MRTKLLKRKTPAFNAFRKLAWDDHYQNILGDAWTPTIANGRGLLIQANEGRKVVGGLSGGMWGGITGIEELVVHPDYKGSGIGRALIEAAEAWTLEHNGRGLSLSTGRRWAAVKFYKRMGFKEAGCAPAFYFGQDFVWLVKMLPLDASR